MAKNPSNWKYKAESQWEKLQKNIAKAESRGYIVPNEIKDIKKPQGGYKQSYERIHKLDLNTIQRQSTYVSPFHGEDVIPGGRAMSIAREMQRDIKTDKDTYVPVEFVYSSMKSLSSRQPSVTINEDTGDYSVPSEDYTLDDYYEDEEYVEPDSYQQSAPQFEEVDEVSPFESEDTMSTEEYYEQLDTNIRDILKSFKSFPLRNKLEKEYYSKLNVNYVKAISNIAEQEEDVITNLQKAAELRYSNTDDYKEEESQYQSWWLEVLLS